MIPKNSRNFALYIICLAVLMTTLFFGFKPKGYRFINQVKWRNNETGAYFTNIGMLYSEKELGKLGINDSIGFFFIIKPVLETKRRLFRIVTIIDKNGKEIFSIDQWGKEIIISLFRSNGKRISHLSVPNILSAKSERAIAAGISGKTIWVMPDKDSCIQETLEKDLSFLPDCLANGKLLLGLSSSGKNPWIGILRELIIGNGRVFYIAPNLLKGDRNDLCDSCPRPQIAHFLFEKPSDRIIRNHCRNDWNFIFPIIPKIFDYKKPQSLHNDVHSINRSLFKDMIINYLGFIPFGIVFFLFFISLRKTMMVAGIYTLLFALCISAGIEAMQIFILTRTSQIVDIILNSGGALSGILCTAITIKIVPIFYHHKL